MMIWSRFFKFSQEALSLSERRDWLWQLCVLPSLSQGLEAPSVFYDLWHHPDGYNDPWLYNCYGLKDTLKIFCYGHHRSPPETAAPYKSATSCTGTTVV